jgi:hypothetical protein
MNMPRKHLFDIDLLDTKTNRVVAKGTASGSFPMEALRHFSKTLPRTIDLTEYRDATSQHDRYVFMHKKKR